MNGTKNMCPHPEHTMTSLAQGVSYSTIAISFDLSHFSLGLTTIRRVIQAPFLNMYFGILEFSFGHQKTVTWVFGCTELFSEVESTKILVFGTVTVPNFFDPRRSTLILRCFID